MKPGRDDSVGWLGYLNIQGLYLPSTEFIQLLESFEKSFDEMNGSTLMTETDPMGKLIDILKGVNINLELHQLIRNEKN